jgi:hypothetical protein
MNANPDSAQYIICSIGERMYTYCLVEPLPLMCEIKSVSKIYFKILYYAQGTYCAKPMGYHLDRIHSDQNVLEVIRRGGWSLL